MAKRKGLIGQTYHRVGSTIDSSLSIVDNGMRNADTAMGAFAPMAQEVLNDAKAELVESIINLARVRKSAEAELIELGYTDIEVAEMLALTK
jgi:hypothetical protein